QTEQSVDNLVKEFETASAFWPRFEVAKKLVARGDKSALPALESRLSDEERHERCVAAFVFAGLGNDRGLEVMLCGLKDMCERPERGVVPNNWSVEGQMRAERYFAVHVLGELEERRAVPILVSLLRDEEINYSVAWALGEIGDERAIGPLIEALRNKSSDM